MPLPPDFPRSPYATLDPDSRWVPDQADFGKNHFPPLVSRLRSAVRKWRDADYTGATETSSFLLDWWFRRPHHRHCADGGDSEFRYYFAQREAVETVIYLHDVVKAKDKYDLMRFADDDRIHGGMFPEAWPRYVVKMATGTGKTKVLSLILAWSYFHRLYESDSALARNFLVIAPNIIVLERLQRDLEGLRIFFQDPVVPDNRAYGRDWRSDFQLTVHIQDDVGVVQPLGNIFLTNIHRVYSEPEDDAIAEADPKSYLLGPEPVRDAADTGSDLGDIVRDVDELVVLNDEAHHIHDNKLAWFLSLSDIHRRLAQRNGGLALQVDTTATPRHADGAIFAQTVSDYPLVEAIAQGLVKRPVLPDQPSRDKLVEVADVNYARRFRDYLELGVVEWRKAVEEHQASGRKAILFVMTDDTKNCDAVAQHLEALYPELESAVLTIHTRRNEEVFEPDPMRRRKTKSPKADDLETLRDLANGIDDSKNQYRAIVSVMVLKEGWDVRNVTTIVGLRAFTAPSKILPEQTLGRGLRRMYPGRAGEEKLSVIGTDAFMEFVENIRDEGVDLAQVPMGPNVSYRPPLVIEVDERNPNKDIDGLDVELPVLTPRVFRAEVDFAEIDVAAIYDGSNSLVRFEPDGQREIVFRDFVTDEVTHVSILDAAGHPNYRGVIAHLARTLMRRLRRATGYDVLYGKIMEFVSDHLFDEPVSLDDAHVVRNLGEGRVVETVLATFQKAIDELTVMEAKTLMTRDFIRLRDTPRFEVSFQESVIPRKSVFNLIVGDSGLELDFARFLEKCPDVLSYAKLDYPGINFKIEYVSKDGAIVHYFPDFVVRTFDGGVYIVETKGHPDPKETRKLERLRQWCEDVNHATNSEIYDFVYVHAKDFRGYAPQTFSDLVRWFRKYKEEND